MVDTGPAIAALLLADDVKITMANKVHVRWGQDGKIVGEVTGVRKVEGGWQIEMVIDENFDYLSGVSIAGYRSSRTIGSHP